MYTPNKTKLDFAAAVKEATRLARDGEITFIRTSKLEALNARLAAAEAHINQLESPNRCESIVRRTRIEWQTLREGANDD